MDLAVGIIIGVAFGAIVTSLVSDIVMPVSESLLAGSIFRTTTYLCHQKSRLASLMPMLRSKEPSLAWASL